MVDKKRLDVALFDQGMAQSRERARSIIMAGQVFVNNQKADKPGMPVKPNDLIEVRGKTLPYVSRGGLKLEKALQCFPIQLRGSVAMDIGASTGGFTDCMLHNGCSKVYAIDVGYGQLAWKLRTDPRVINMERTNFRYLTQAQIPEPIDFASVDVSFISLSKILPVLYPLLKSEGSAVCLIKPQFEAGRDKIGKKGVVRDKIVHKETIENVLTFTRENGFFLSGLTFSPVKGPEGNIEYLMYIKKSKEIPEPVLVIQDIVEESHLVLDGGGEKNENCNHPQFD